MTKKQFLILALSACLFPCGCAVNPATGENQLMLISPAQELQMGRQYAPEIERQLDGRIEDLTVQNYIQNVGQKIGCISHMPNLQYCYTALNHKTINAMALPGGYVFITRGMLEKLDSEAQLAAILAHETAHVTARHAAQAITTQIGMDMVLSAVSDNTSSGAVNIASIGSQIIGLKYSREHENQADLIGLDYMVRAGYNPVAMIETMEILQQQNAVRPIEFLSTHPNPENRKKVILKQISNKGYPTGLRTGRDDYHKFVRANLNK